MTSLDTERRVNQFFLVAKNDPHIWSGLLRSMYRFPEEGIHVRCLDEARKAQLLQTDWIEPVDPLFVSPNMISVTRFTDDARKLLAAKVWPVL